MVKAPIARLLVVLGLLAFLLASLPALAAPMKVTLGGYVQARFDDQLGTGSGTSSFQAFRPSVLIRATDEEHVFAQLFLSTGRGSSSFEVQHAFAEYQAKPYFVRLGLAPIPFGYENPITSCKLITMERSQASSVLVGPWALDRGLYGFYLPGKGLNFAIGAINGESYLTSRDTNNSKNIVARLGYSIPGGEIGVSYLDGTTQTIPANPAAVPPFAGFPAANVSLFGVDLVTKQGPFTIVSEYFNGDATSISATTGAQASGNGAYLTAAYRPADWKFEPYARYDFFNPASGLDYDRITVGTGYYLNPMSKVSLEYQNIDDDANPAVDGNIAAQYQIIF